MIGMLDTFPRHWMAEEEKEKDWLELPAELIHLIAKKLPDLLDFIRFRAVCKTWRSSTLLSDPPYQLPWLLELSQTEYCPQGTLRPQQRFFSISSGETITIAFTNIKTALEKWIKGGVCSHYLAFSDDKIMSFFNPLTKDLFLLPPMRYFLYLGAPCMVWTGTAPIHDRSIVVLDRTDSLWNDNIAVGAFYDPYKSKWVYQFGQFNSSCYLKGMFFSTCARGPTKVFDAYSNELLHTVLPPDNELTDNPFDGNEVNELPRHFITLKQSFLVVSLGVILRVSWFHGWCAKGSLFNIYRLHYETADGTPFWVRIHDIGDQTLFLEEVNGFSMTARPSTGFREGCIYFIDPHNDEPYMHDILAGTVERMPCPFKRCTWFLPGL
ncbi:hypothetical protein LUZ63_000461 [Rhynchospora breviuscula]|uniref:F-box domain-containing protein n=1 Tax=Rhynchospora breviuscula TaxID=2022672 RepID=A0A9Q0CV25_9POAL|nr:hypothetical protein LUZ63_000461 [Rhynchospora breviuscula]